MSKIFIKFIGHFNPICDMITKKQQLLNAIESDNFPLALRIAKDFIIDFSPEQQRILQIAHECQDPSKARFYSALKIDVAQCKTTAAALLQQFKLTKS